MARVVLDTFFVPKKTWKDAAAVRHIHQVQIIAAIVQLIACILSYINYVNWYQQNALLPTAHVLLNMSITAADFASQRNLADGYLNRDRLYFWIINIPLMALIIIFWTVPLSTAALDILTGSTILLNSGIYLTKIFTLISKFQSKLNELPSDDKRIPKLTDSLKALSMKNGIFIIPITLEIFKIAFAIATLCGKDYSVPEDILNRLSFPAFLLVVSGTFLGRD